MNVRTLLSIGALLLGLTALLGIMVIGRPDWKAPLASALNGADRIVVESAAAGGANESASARHEIIGADKIAEFLSAIEIDPKKSGPRAPVGGEVRLTFFKSDWPAAVLEYAGGPTLRWVNGRRPADAHLTEKSQSALAEFLRAGGYARFSEIRAAESARLAREAAEDAAFAAPFPEPVRDLILKARGSSPFDSKKREAEVGSKIAAAMNDPVALAAAACRALGALDDGWSVRGERERRVIAAVATVEGAAFERALECIAGDRGALLGAARLLFRENFDLRTAEPARTRWAIRAAEAVFLHGRDDDKSIALRRLPQSAGSGVWRFLAEVAEGTIGRENPRTATTGQEPRLRAAAALAIAENRDRRAEPWLRKVLSSGGDPYDVAAAEVGLALLGDPTYLKAEHFRFESYAIGLAGLKAIEGFDGSHGLDVLAGAALDHPWAAVRNEAVRTAERITKQKFVADDRVQEGAFAEAVRKWWIISGAEFVKTRREAGR
jgi:hypothetical protein